VSVRDNGRGSSTRRHGGWHANSMKKPIEAIGAPSGWYRRPTSDAMWNSGFPRTPNEGSGTDRLRIHRSNGGRPAHGWPDGTGRRFAIRVLLVEGPRSLPPRPRGRSSRFRQRLRGRRRDARRRGGIELARESLPDVVLMDLNLRRPKRRRRHPEDPRGVAERAHPGALGLGARARCPGGGQSRRARLCHQERAGTSFVIDAVRRAASGEAGSRPHSLDGHRGVRRMARLDPRSRFSRRERTRFSVWWRRAPYSEIGRKLSSPRRRLRTRSEHPVDSSRAHPVQPMRYAIRRGLDRTPD